MSQEPPVPRTKPPPANRLRRIVICSACLLYIVSFTKRLTRTKLETLTFLVLIFFLLQADLSGLVSMWFSHKTLFNMSLSIINPGVGGGVLDPSLGIGFEILTLLGTKIL